MPVSELEPWEIALQEMQQCRLVPWQSSTELQDEVIWAYSKLEETYRQWRKKSKQMDIQLQPVHLGHVMNIQWSEEDQLYIVTVPDLPGCMTHGYTYEEAVQQGKDAIESWLSWEE